MTAYRLTPVGAEGLEHDRAERVEVRSYHDLEAENAQLRLLLAETVAAREAWHTAWKAAVDSRLADRDRLQRASRVLASLGRLSPRMAAAVEVSRREIWELDR